MDVESSNALSMLLDDDRMTDPPRITSPHSKVRDFGQTGGGSSFKISIKKKGKSRRKRKGNNKSEAFEPAAEALANTAEALMKAGKMRILEHAMSTGAYKLYVEHLSSILAQLHEVQLLHSQHLQIYLLV